MAQLPPDHGREVAFAGRSNAGKSSAINAITGRKGLARVGNTPGRTRLLNFFTLDPDNRLVDLPGYGYAKVSHAEQTQWQATMAAYLEQRRSLAALILVVDARHPLSEFDERLLEWSQAAELPTHVLLTKADKLGRGALMSRLQSTSTLLQDAFPGTEAQSFSAVSREGIEGARMWIAQWLKFPRIPKKSPGNKGKESGAQKKSRHRGRDLPRSGRRSG